MEKNHKIDEIKEKDLNQLEKLQKDVFNSITNYEKLQKFYQESKNNKDMHVLGYYIGDNLVGTVTLHMITLPSGKEATIWNLAVDPGYRRLGIASKLMDRVEEIAKSDNEVRRIWLFSGKQREGAHKLYSKLGYDEKRDKAFVKEI